MTDCIFCKIAQGQIPSKIAYEDEDVIAFYDQDPRAPVHVLVIPKTHVSSLGETDGLTDQQLAACLRACGKVAEMEGLKETGFRVVSNCGKDACQSVGHLHFHVLGGRSMKEQMA